MDCEEVHSPIPTRKRVNSLTKVRAYLDHEKQKLKTLDWPSGLNPIENDWGTSSKRQSMGEG